MDPSKLNCITASSFQWSKGFHFSPIVSELNDGCNGNLALFAFLASGSHYLLHKSFNKFWTFEDEPLCISHHHQHFILCEFNLYIVLPKLRKKSVKSTLLFFLIDLGRQARSDYRATWKRCFQSRKIFRVLKQPQLIVLSILVQGENTMSFLSVFFFSLSVVVFRRRQLSSSFPSITKVWRRQR